MQHRSNATVQVVWTKIPIASAFPDAGNTANASCQYAMIEQNHRSRRRHDPLYIRLPIQVDFWNCNALKTELSQGWNQGPGKVWPYIQPVRLLSKDGR